MWIRLQFVTFFLFHAIFSQENKVDLEIYFESLCPDSFNFITKQLYPVWNDIAPYVNVKFIPFGKSVSVKNGDNFVCQHGPRECMGNRIQSCALAALPNQSTQMEFVNCFMRTFYKTSKHEYEFGQSCVAAVGLDWTSVVQCYNSPMGKELQLQAELDTAKIAPKFIPIVVYNGQFNQLAQDDSLRYFRGVVCSFISQFDPRGCQSEQSFVIDA